MSPPLILSAYPVSVLDYIAIYAFVALGLVVTTGIGGVTSFGQAAFMGIGAYATAWWTTVMGGGPFAGPAIGLVVAGVTALVLGAATLRLRGRERAALVPLDVTEEGSVKELAASLGAKVDILVNTAEHHRVQKFKLRERGIPAGVWDRDKSGWSPKR